MPSSLTLKKYISFLEKRYRSKVKRFLFRGKHFGWTNPVVDVTFENGKSKWWYPKKNIYYTNFDKANLQRLSCFRCKYSCESRCGDITIGDFWGIQDLIPGYHKNGYSAVMIRSEKGMTAWDKILDEITFKEVSYADIYKGNPVCRESVKEPFAYKYFMMTYKKIGLKRAFQSAMFLNKIQRRFN